MKIGTVEVLNTSGKGGARDRVVVRREGEEIARIELRHRDPLGYIRKWHRGKYATSLKMQLAAAGVDERTIALIVTPDVGPRPRTHPTQTWFSVLAP